MVSQRERLASHAHDMWSGWMKYLFSKCEEGTGGDLVIPVSFVTRWKRQMSTPYSELSISERESDLKEADGILGIVIPEIDEDNYEKYLAEVESLMDSGEDPTRLAALGTAVEEYERTQLPLDKVTPSDVIKHFQDQELKWDEVKALLGKDRFRTMIGGDWANITIGEVRQLNRIMGVNLFNFM